MTRPPIDADALLRALVDCTPGAVTIKDRDGVYRMVNVRGAAALGRTPEELVGRRDAEVLDAATLEAVRPHDAAVLATGATHEYEIRFRAIDGERIAFTRKAPWRDATGAIVGTVSLSMDVTGRRELERRVAAGERMEAVGRFASGIAHDFNNLLTTILGNAQLLQRRARDDERLRPLAEAIVQASMRASELTGQLVAFSRDARRAASDLDAVIPARGRARSERAEDGGTAPEDA